MAPNNQVTALGVDYGTTSSLAAVALPGRAPEVVAVPQRPDGPVLDRLPGYLYFPTRGRIVVGEVARNLFPLKPHKVVRSVKRDLDGCWTIGRTTYTSSDLVKLTLRELLAAARESASGPLRNLVLTVPSTFGQAQRRTLIDAALAADRWVSEVTLLDEPLAAFLSYLDEARMGRCEPPPRRAKVLVFDMGGGTTDISVLDVQGDGLRSWTARVLGVSSDTGLGGDDFDRALAGHLASIWMDGHTIDSGQLTDSERRWVGGKLTVAAEQAKVDLGTGRSDTRVRVEGLPVKPVMDLVVDRSTYEQVIDSLLTRVFETLRQGFDVAGLGPHDIDVVVLAGGMARCGAVRDVVDRLFGATPVMLANPMTAVVRGACLHHQAMVGDGPAVLLEPLKPVLTESVGIRLAGGQMMTLIEAGSELPVSRTVSDCLTTPHTGCSAIRLPLYGQPHASSGPRKVIATLTLCSDVELPGGQPVTIEIHADTNKLVTVRATLADGGQRSRTLTVQGL